MYKVTDVEGNPWHKQGEFEHRANHGIRGAHVVMPFQCEECHFLNLEGRRPRPNNPLDDTYRKLIRRVNLDMINGRAKSTILSHANEVMRTVKDCKRLGKTPSYATRGPMPLEDKSGMGLGVEMMYRSLVARGKVSKEGYVQYDTLRRKRATVSTVYASSPGGIGEMSSFSKGTNKVSLTSCPSQSEAFALFSTGAERRMGYETQADKPLHISVVALLLKNIREAAEAEPSLLLANQLWKAGAAVAVGLMGSLRGPEIWMLDLAGIRRHIEVGRNGVLPANPLRKGVDLFQAPHVVLCLLGVLKGETGAREHMLAVASTSLSGIDVRWWVEKLISVRLAEGCVSGPAFGDANGSVVSSFDMNGILHHHLSAIQAVEPELLLPTDNVIINYSFDRTFRKTAEGRARAAGLSGDVQDAMNRWVKVERAQGRRPRFNMRDHYSNVRDLMPVTWRYSYVQ